MEHRGARGVRVSVFARIRSTAGRRRERFRKDSDMSDFLQTTSTAAAADDKSIRPFQFHAPEEMRAAFRSLR